MRRKTGTWLRAAAALAVLLSAALPLAAESFPEPPRIPVKSDPVDLYVQFTVFDVLYPGRAQVTPTWTRAYGLEQGKSLIPGPSFYFRPGDLLQITLNNLLDTNSEDAGFNEALEQYETNLDPTFDTDDIIEHVHGEINIPHNPNNTNLHVHGLHVDPSQDDVTLILIPQGDSKLNYSQALWPYIREQIWPYRYRVPADHLPGTHWYHAHKHGSTSLHVENGMAGALIMQPKDPADDIVPGLAPEDDRVMILQEIANYGIQQGIAEGTTITDFDVDSAAVSKPGIGPPSTGEGKKNRPLITVNGEVTPTLSLAPGQLQRWRFINAAANHASFSYLWLGKSEGTDENGNAIYREVPMQLVAIDGITFKRKVPVTAERPVFLGPGNRADVLVRLAEAGTYALFKNFPEGVVVQGQDGNTIDPAAEQDQIANPYLLPEENPVLLDYVPEGSTCDSSSLETPNGPVTGPNFEHYLRCWLNLDATPGSATYGQPVSVSLGPIAPSLAVRPAPLRDGAVFLDLDYPTDVDEDPLGWQPIAAPDIGGGMTDTQLLFNVEVAGDPVQGPSMPTDEHLAKISPTGNPGAAPAYVAPITDRDVLQSRTALFDLSGINVVVYQGGTAEQQIRQFTLNGRQFDLDDSIGSPRASAEIAEAPSLPETTAEGQPEEGEVELVLAPVEAHGLWHNQCWTNPGYYQQVEKTTVTLGGKAQETYRYAAAANPCGGQPPTLTYEQVTGIEQVSVVNGIYPGADRVAGVPGLPVATTAEEWVLINNSPIGHPFHIHINPFFITEIGQLSYEGFKGDKACGGKEDNKAWVIRTINPQPDGTATDACAVNKPTGPMTLTGTSTLWWVVGNWWDTIVIPPHGYVKFRYWMNVPQQNWDATEIADNVNRFGNWVYHCHILRHEDRGMMMIVGTQPKREKAGEED